MTQHHVYYQPAQKMSELADESLDLVVTSPPYPMIALWDEIMMRQNPKIRESFENQQFELAFELMHQELDKVWEACFRVLKNGGHACINIGDATRTLDKNFALYPNHARIIQACLKAGFQNLPNIIWRKQTNAPNKFMGSGMLPPGAYVTLEHEFILIFRKGQKRVFKTDCDKANRQQSSYFWEERNRWFSDLWELKGASQKLTDKKTRERSGAYPFQIPFRLINMFSVQGDTVLDPFLGTGTTALASIASKRHSVGYEIDTNLKETIQNHLLRQEMALNQINQNRLIQHKKFVEERQNAGKTLKHHNQFYDFPVMTKQEINLKLPLVKQIDYQDNKFEVLY